MTTNNKVGAGWSFSWMALIMKRSALNMQPVLFQRWVPFPPFASTYVVFEQIELSLLKALKKKSWKTWLRRKTTGAPFVAQTCAH
mmetsp:Transcript_9569/g.16790  ORF Transcript_9569/g.16790 Transcript_9569/m.16790 type:complete len:85 (-) Transcript_9569:1514-1768(-)